MQRFCTVCSTGMSSILCYHTCLCHASYFNCQLRSVMEYAKKLFPEAVDVRTFHSLAHVGLDVR